MHQLIRHEINPSVNKWYLVVRQIWTKKHILRIICGPGGKPVLVFCFFLVGPSSSETFRLTAGVAPEEPSGLAFKTGVGLGARCLCFLIGQARIERSQDSGVGLRRLVEARMAESKTVRDRKLSQ